MTGKVTDLRRKLAGSRILCIGPWVECAVILVLIYFSGNLVLACREMAHRGRRGSG